MASSGFENITALVNDTALSRPSGRISEISDGVVRISGLAEAAALGDLIRLEARGGVMGAEVVALGRDGVSVVPDAAPGGLSIGDPAILLGPARLRPDDSWLGRVVDPFGTPLDGRPVLPGTVARGVDGPPPAAVTRRGLGARIATGYCAFDTFLPIVRGQRIGLFAGSGVGKSTLLAGLATRLEADVVVIAMVGERGREVRHFIDAVLGPEGMARSVIVAATSDQAAPLRRRCAPSAMTIAEHFRDAGRHVLLLIDSVTRFADAHREVALSQGEGSGFAGYPPSVVPAITGLSERAGPGAEGQGDITAVFSVLVAGSDMEGPVADTLRGVLDGHVVLDRSIAERGRFPAVDLLRSVSRALPDAATTQENTLLSEGRRLIGAYEKSEMMIRAGLYATGSDKTVDAAIAAWPKLDRFLGQSEPKGVHASFMSLARCLSRKTEQVETRPVSS